MTLENRNQEDVGALGEIKVTEPTNTWRVHHPGEKH